MCTAQRVRVWIYGDSQPEPTGPLTVRDDRGRLWSPTGHGDWQTTDGHHHEKWAALHATTDLVALDPEPPTTP